MHDANDSAFDGAQAFGWRLAHAAGTGKPVQRRIRSSGRLWYRHQFTLHGLTPDAMPPRCLTASITLPRWRSSGKTLARHEGYFQRFPVDITGVVRRHNQLAVRVDSPMKTRKRSGRCTKR